VLRRMSHRQPPPGAERRAFPKVEGRQSAATASIQRKRPMSFAETHRPFLFHIAAAQDATACVLGALLVGCVLFLLPGGRPRRGFPVISAIQAGGRPRRGPRPRAKRSKLRIASSICSRSDFNSARILLTSIEGLRPTVAFRRSRSTRILVEPSIHSNFHSKVLRFQGRNTQLSHKFLLQKYRIVISISLIFVCSNRTFSPVMIKRQTHQDQPDS
jgi:hypothetical protein